MSKFAHLHVHTEFSLLDGLSKIGKLVSQAKIYGQKHLAITDHGAMYGAIKFYKECTQEGINPIIGCEMYIAKRSLTEKEAGEDKEYSHLTVLAQNEEGYRNLMKLVTVSHLEGFYYRPRVDKEHLAKYSKGLIALSGCNSSEISKAFVASDLKKAKKLAEVYRQIFGKDNFYLEVQRHEFDKFQKAHEQGSEIYNELGKMASQEQKILANAKKLSKDLGKTDYP
jgi:DNA polymerase-3 subunit alpha